MKKPKTILKQLELELNVQKLSLGIDGINQSEIVRELKNISELIEQWNITATKGKSGKPKFSGIGPIHDEIYHSFERLVTIIPKEIKKCKGIPLIFDVSDFYNIPDIIVRKCLVFGETTILVLPPVLKYEFENTLYPYYKLPTVLINIFHKYQSIIHDGLLIPVPISAFNYVDKRFPNITNTGYHKFSKDQVVQYFGVKGKIDELFALSENHIFFPALTNVRFNTIRKLREKEYNTFRKFHENLSILKKENAFESENELVELIKETDYQVRLIDSKYKERKRTKRIDLATSITGLLSATLLANADSASLKMASAILGTTSGIRCIKLLANNIKVKNHFVSEGYYFPWKLS